jgi:hypothetical protein
MIILMNNFDNETLTEPASTVTDVMANRRSSNASISQLTEEIQDDLRVFIENIEMHVKISLNLNPTVN